MNTNRGYDAAPARVGNPLEPAPPATAELQLPTPDDERAVHLAILVDELWSPACHPAWKWGVPLAYQAEQVTCPTCRREAVRRGRL